MSTSDVIAIYGAILSSALAGLQFIQWRHSKKFISIRYREYCGNDDSTIEAVISNRGQFNVTLDFVAFGFCGRYLRTPWRLEPLNLCSIPSISSYAEDGAELGKPIDGLTLQPGQLIRVGARREQFDRLNRYDDIGNQDAKLFAVRPCIWIEHSQSDIEICQVVRFLE